MKITSPCLIAASILIGLASTFFAQERAARPDLSGTWKLSKDMSDDITAKFLEHPDSQTPEWEKNTREYQEQIEALFHFARGLERIEINHTADDVTVADEDGDVRIYYPDGRERRRETKWGESLQVDSKWMDDQLIIRTRGVRTGIVQETYGLEGHRLVYILRVIEDSFPEAVVVRHYFDREEE